MCLKEPVEYALVRLNDKGHVTAWYGPEHDQPVTTLAKLVTRGYRYEAVLEAASPAYGTDALVLWKRHKDVSRVELPEVPMCDLVSIAANGGI